MFLTVLVLIIAVCGCLVLVFSLMNKDKAGWIQFHSKGKEAGFSFKEIELLRKLAVKSNLVDPASLFTSQHQLDMCIRSLVRSIHLSGGADDQGNQDFLSKLYDFRKKIEIDKKSVKNGITSSRQLSDGQNLRVLVKGSGVFRSQIVKNASNFITITRPVSGKLPGSFTWTGMKISVYLWREDDAGYVFDTEVTDEVFSKGFTSLQIPHSDKLFRTQKRKSIRVKLHKSVFMYLITNEDEANRLEVNPGLKCFMEDLSDTGCAITVGGKAASGLRVKIQFALNNTPIVMPGSVRSVEFKEDMNRSLLHIENDLLPIEIRNQILGEVFGMLPDDEEDLPFRLLGDGTDEMGAGADLNSEDSGFSGDDFGAGNSPFRENQ